VRRSVTPGRHRKVARRLAGGSTFPVLVLGDEAIGDSTRIVAALEQRYPEPPLYPADPDERRRALDIEDYFDEELGPHLRLLLLHSVLSDPGLTLGMFAPGLTGARRAVARATFGRVRRKIVNGFGIDPDSVERANTKLHAACERFARELEPSGYLVADRFTIADLAVAALVSPAVAPEQFPYPQPQRGHPLTAPVREALSEHGLADWARGIYARHRGTSAEVASHGSAPASPPAATVASLGR
jgi:glutathione S-transferase